MMQQSQLYDISRTVSPSLAVWPGDTTFSATHVLRLSEGAAVNLTTLNLSAHTGSHADAYYHFSANGPTIAEMPLDAYIGPAVVVSVAREHGAILPEDVADHPLLQAPEGADFAHIPRLLLHTWVSDVPDGEWPGGFPYPSPALIDWLAARGGRLLGLDSPSVDDEPSRDLPGHHRLRERGLANLENLCLAGVPDGHYELAALPLKLAGACGSPVRAVLRPLPNSLRDDTSAY